MRPTVAWPLDAAVHKSRHLFGPAGPRGVHPTAIRPDSQAPVSPCVTRGPRCLSRDSCQPRRRRSEFGPGPSPHRPAFTRLDCAHCTVPRFTQYAVRHRSGRQPRSPALPRFGRRRHGRHFECNTARNIRFLRVTFPGADRQRPPIRPSTFDLVSGGRVALPVPTACAANLPSTAGRARGPPAGALRSGTPGNSWPRCPHI